MASKKGLTFHDAVSAYRNSDRLRRTPQFIGWATDIDGIKKPVFRVEGRHFIVLDGITPKGERPIRRNQTLQEFTWKTVNVTIS